MHACTEDKRKARKTKEVWGKLGILAYPVWGRLKFCCTNCFTSRLLYQEIFRWPHMGENLGPWEVWSVHL